jgi:PadR family transcriptional regulator, regulatory protein AphA
MMACQPEPGRRGTAPAFLTRMAKPMSTRHTILTILKMQPDSGYGLAYRNEASMQPLWSATHSQIYTALRQLLEEGLVQARSGKNGKNGSQRESTVYSLTEAGQRELECWQLEPIKYPPRKDPFRFRLAHMNELPLEAVEAMVAGHVKRHRRLADRVRTQAAEFRDGGNPDFERRHASLPNAELRRLRAARVAVYEEIARWAEFEVESAERLRKVARSLGPPKRKPVRKRAAAATMQPTR